MKNLYIIILITLITFILYITHNTKEYFTLNKKTIILLGDSVFNNNSYVEKGKAVNEILQKNADENTSIICLARNDSTINNVYQQLENVNIDIDLNDKLTTVFLSVGGNDIMKLQQQNLDDIFEKYNTLIAAITTKLPNVKLVLLNIYYPANISKYDSLIDKWNTNIDLEYEYNDKNIYILNLSNLLKEPFDFVFDIEPSIAGGEKIANKILNI